MASIVQRLAAGALLAAVWLAGPAAAAPATPAPPAAAAGTRTGATSPAPVAPRPALWLLADSDTRIYLFGTVHILPPGLQWRSAALERAIAQADELVLEVDEAQSEPALAGLVEQMQLGKEAPIEWRVSPDRREALREMVAASGIEIESLAGLQTWAVALTLTAVEIARAYAPDDSADVGATLASLSGVEDALTRDFQTRGRPISGVETAEEQIALFTGGSFQLQREMLEQMVDAYVGGERLMEPDDAAWLAGDVAAIAAEMEQMPPELIEAMLDRRNRAWTGWLIERLERPGTVLFAVGAGHLAGPRSVQAMLAERGLRVTRLD